MVWNDALETLVGEFGLTPETIYLLPLVPLIDVMWADGVLQPSEISIFYECLTRHLADLYQQADGEEPISVARAEKFVDGLLNTRPDPEKLHRLRDLSVQVLNLSPDARLRRSVLDSCLDLAAIAVTRYPYNRRDRVMIAEKRVLHELFESLNLKS